MTASICKREPNIRGRPCSAFHKTFHVPVVSEVPLKFPKLTMNLAILFRSCQSNRELGNEVVNFRLNVAKLVY